MKRIASATKAVDLFGAGKHGFKNGDPTTGDPATQLNAEWFNGYQEEAVAAVEAAGITLDGGKTNQLASALAVGAGSLAAAGTANAIALTIPLWPDAVYASGRRVRFWASAANTGATTIAVNGMAAKSVKRRDGSALQANDIPAAGAYCEAIYDGTNFQLLLRAV